MINNRDIELFTFCRIFSRMVEQVLRAIILRFVALDPGAGSVKASAPILLPLAISGRYTFLAN
ncbi:hypothetical protein [Peribacillus simplex]|uniref:hypothetical protein n=1 Tax=Peribacillus simplex TaxID=1478 RepID=UPI003D2E66BD